LFIKPPVGRLDLKPPSGKIDLDGQFFQNNQVFYFLSFRPIEVRKLRRPVEGNRPY